MDCLSRRDKKIILIKYKNSQNNPEINKLKERQYIFVPIDKLDNYEIYFSNMCECVAVILETTKDNFYYYKFAHDSKNFFKKVLKDTFVRYKRDPEKDIVAASLFGGNLNDRVLPLNDDGTESYKYKNTQKR